MCKSSSFWSAGMYSRLATAELHSFNAPTSRVPGVSPDTGWYILARDGSSDVVYQLDGLN